MAVVPSVFTCSLNTTGPGVWSEGARQCSGSSQGKEFSMERALPSPWFGWGRGKMLGEGIRSP